MIPVISSLAEAPKGDAWLRHGRNGGEMKIRAPWFLCGFLLGQAFQVFIREMAR